MARNTWSTWTLTIWTKEANGDYDVAAFSGYATREEAEEDAKNYDKDSFEIVRMGGISSYLDNFDIEDQLVAMKKKDLWNENLRPGEWR